MTRRVVEHGAESIDREKLIVVTVYEEGVNKEHIKRMNRYSKRYSTLLPRGEGYEWRQ